MLQNSIATGADLQPAPSGTLTVQADIHHTMLDLHVPAEIALQVELAGAIRALERFATCVKMHMAQQVVHTVEGFPTNLEKRGEKTTCKQLLSQKGSGRPVGLDDSSCGKGA